MYTLQIMCYKIKLSLNPGEKSNYKKVHSHIHTYTLNEQLQNEWLLKDTLSNHALIQRIFVLIFQSPVSGLFHLDFSNFLSQPSNFDITKNLKPNTSVFPLFNASQVTSCFLHGLKASDPLNSLDQA